MTNEGLILFFIVFVAPGIALEIAERVRVRRSA